MTIDKMLEHDPKKLEKLIQATREMRTFISSQTLVPERPGAIDHEFNERRQLKTRAFLDKIEEMLK